MARLTLSKTFVAVLFSIMAATASAGDSCIWANDGTCDEPTMCSAGTDETDCSCTADSECGTSFFDNANFCVGGTCKECETDDHCKQTFCGGWDYCGTDNVCHKCLNHDHCTGTDEPACLDQSSGNECGECTLDAHCTSKGGHGCDTTFDECNECTTSADCPGDATCYSGECSGCTSHADCAADEYCAGTSTAAYCYSAAMCCDSTWGDDAIDDTSSSTIVCPAQSKCCDTDSDCADGWSCSSFYDACTEDYTWDTLCGAAPSLQIALGAAMAAAVAAMAQ